MLEAMLIDSMAEAMPLMKERCFGCSHLQYSHCRVLLLSMTLVWKVLACLSCQMQVRTGASSQPYSPLLAEQRSGCCGQMATVPLLMGDSRLAMAFRSSRADGCVLDGVSVCHATT